MQTHTLTLLASYQAEDLLWWFGNIVMVLMFCAAHEAAIRTRLPINKVLLDRRQGQRGSSLLASRSTLCAKKSETTC